MATKNGVPDVIRADIHAAIDRFLDEPRHIIILAASPGPDGDLRSVATTTQEDFVEAVLSAALAAHQTHSAKIIEMYTAEDVEKKQ